MPLDNPTPYRINMFHTSLIRSTNKFILSRYLNKYLLNEAALSLNGYQPVPLRFKIKKGFKGFAGSQHDILLDIDDVQRFPPESYPISVRTTLPPSLRPKFGEYLDAEKFYFARLYISPSNFTLGGADFNPQLAMLSVKDFPKIIMGADDDGHPIYSFPVRKWRERETLYLTETGVKEEKVDNKARICFPVNIINGMELIEHEVKQEKLKQIKKSSNP